MLALMLAHVLVAMLAWARAKARRHVTAAPLCSYIHGGGVFERNALTESACLFLILNDDRFFI